MRTLQLKNDLYWAGILDKDLRVFDIIMYTEFGTTYNSYILKAGDKTILFETAKEKFYDDYRAALTEQLDIDTIDYIVVSHTEPDHAGSIQRLVQENPKVKIIATATAISFLKEIVNEDFYSIAVNDGDEMKIGNKTLRFLLVPNLHWPDTMYTYVVEDKTLVTCDSFGSHYAHEGILRSTVTDYFGYLRATKYYFENILGPFRQPYMTDALRRVRELEIDMICPGHGPVHDSHIEELMAIYDAWCQLPVNEKTTVVIPYVSAYGYTEQLAEKITEGIKEAGDIDVRSYDLVEVDAAAVAGEIGAADGILFGTPTILQEALKPIWDLTTGLYAPIHGGKLASAFGSYGWSGEGVPHIIERLKQVNMRVVDGFTVRLKPSEKDLAEAFEFGYQFGVKLLQGEVKKPSARAGLVKCLVCGEIIPSDAEVCPVCGVGPDNFVPVADPDTGFRKDSEERFVILGGGTAALNAAKNIRLRNSTASIVMLSEESELPYDRPMLTKAMFGAVSNGAIASEPAEWYKENNVDLRLNSKVEKLDAEKKEVILTDGSVFSYDKCIYALGSSSFIPPFKGKDLPEVISIRSIKDVEKVNELAKNAKNAVVIGGGVLGLEAAWELRKAKLNVTVLEGAPVLMAGKVDPETVRILTDVAKQKGIEIKVGVKIDEISGAEHVDGVVADGEKIAADLVLVSTGVRANIAIAQAAGLATDRAVIVDKNMASSAADIYAAGDCAQYDGANITIWPVASEMGRIAGANAAGEALVYEPEVNGMSFHGMGTSLFSIGDIGTKPDVSYKTVEIKDDKKQTLEKIWFRNNIISGAVLVGDLSRMAEMIDAVKYKKCFKEIF
ncbi:MAG: FAD-dependent oxidoreductase [Anaerotignum sp.]|nr:FAD-dependent oxidoreductase [Anaerotignum sp.]